MSKWKMTNKCHINSMKWNKHKYITNALKSRRCPEAPMMLTCSIYLKARVCLHIYREGNNKTTKEKKRKDVSYMLSRDIIKMQWTRWNANPCPTKHIKTFHFLYFKIYPLSSALIRFSILCSFHIFFSFLGCGSLLTHTHTHPKITFYHKVMLVYL